MEEKGKTLLRCPSRSEGDGMESTHHPRCETIHTSFSNYYHKSFIPSQNKTKGPKFVPYEPYRAAVSPIVSTSHVPEYVIDSQKVQSLASSVLRLHSDTGGKSSINCSPECSSSVKSLEEKIAALEKEKKELATQYQTLTEVNMDLKKMLVASLGEDVQVKVQLMTQDKAQLGQEVLRLSAELEQVSEEAEQMSLRADLWEGKFKASSVLVRELAQWKASFSHNLKSSKELIQMLLAEHNTLFETLNSTHSHLEAIAVAFGVGNIHPSNGSPKDLLQLGMQMKSLSRELREQLLGKQPVQADVRHSVVRQFTRSENEAHQLLQTTEHKSGSDDLTCHLLPHTCTKDLDFCKHCSGAVQNL
ncbi:golgin-45 [Trichonephila inaurata madagascariensis]|uniref:Golgin-45 n=1 Tax=Trichonephila inaurata madagascariensis TaxID=2747483 RepID=A0A8X6IRV9_9ARAC|nr:golgin-45 [Trichonephila inaurata madagascariensis]